MQRLTQHLLSECSENGSEALTFLTSSARLRGVFSGAEDMTRVVGQFEKFTLENTSTEIRLKRTVVVMYRSKNHGTEMARKVARANRH